MNIYKSILKLPIQLTQLRLNIFCHVSDGITGSFSCSENRITTGIGFIWSFQYLLKIILLHFRETQSP
jgi:hypothetical protein